MTPGFCASAGIFLARNLLKRLLVRHAIAVFRFDLYFLLIAGLQALQFVFEAVDDLSRALDVRERLFADVGVDDFAVIVGERVLDGDDRAFLNVASRLQRDRLRRCSAADRERGW